MAVWAVIVFCGLAASLGIFAANVSETWAKQDAKKRVISDWDFNLESVLYPGEPKYKQDGQIISIAQNDDPYSNQGQQYIKYWQPVEEDYGLSYIALGADGLKDSHYCSSEAFFPSGSNSPGVSNDTRKTWHKNDDSDDLRRSIIASLSLEWNKTNDGFSQDGLFYALPYTRPETGSNKGEEYNSCIFPFQYKTGVKKVSNPTDTADIKLTRDDLDSSKSLANTTAAAQRNDMYFVDHYGAAQRMGKSYDVRQYYSNGYEGKKKADGQVDLDWRNDLGSASGGRPYATFERRHSTPTLTIFEYHFYPKGYLKTLDDSLKFTTLTYTGAYHYKNWECTNLPGSGWVPPWGPDENGNSGGGYHYCIDPIDYSYVDRYATVPTSSFVEYYNVWMRKDDSASITYYYDGRGEFYSGGPSGTNFTMQDVVNRLKGTFKQYYLTSLSQIERASPASISSISPRSSVPARSSSNSRPYISNDVYNDYLKSIEISFKGTARYDDIDGERGEGYVPLSGTHRVYLTPNTVIKASDKVNTGDAQANIKQMGSWYGAYCTSNNNSSAFCQKGAWAVSGIFHGQAADNKNSLWVEFESTPSDPYRIAYYSYNHRSGLSSDSRKVAYVVLDLGDNVNDPKYAALKTAMDNSATQYRNLYDKDFNYEEEKWLKGKGVQKSDPVVYLFEITYTSYYTPNLFNSEILGLDRNAITWYTDRNLTKEAPARIVADDNLVFFTALDRLPKDFPDSCYSNNSSPVPGGS